MRRALQIARAALQASSAGWCPSHAATRTLWSSRCFSRGISRDLCGLDSTSRDAFRVWGSPLVVTALVACQLAESRASSDALEPEALQDLARDLATGTSADKERAVSMLSSLTLYVDHHDAILRTPGVLESLLDSVIDARLVPQVRNIALTCTADLMKDPKAHETALQSAAFVEGLLAALKAEGSWADGLDDGQVAQAQAARCAAELSGRQANHERLIDNGLAAQLATQAGRLVHEFGSIGSEYADVSEVPGSMDATSVMEEERFIGAALFGLAGSTAGAKLLAQRPDTMKGIVHWAQNSKDPILLRWGVGTLARCTAAGSYPQRALAAAGGIPALLSALNCQDPQAQCFASAAVGTLAREGGRAAATIANQGAAPQLLQMVKASQEDGAQSEGVRQGVRRCALNAITACVSNAKLSKALQQAGMADELKALQQQGAFTSEELRRMAEYIVEELS